MTKFKFKLTTQVQLETCESDAKTFGELKNAIKNSPLGEKISFERQTEVREGQEWIRTIKLIEKNTLAEYGSIDDAPLPVGENLLFFVTPVEHKGGLDPTDIPFLEKDEALDQVDELGYNELISLGSKLNSLYDAEIDLSGKRDDVWYSIKVWLEAWYDDCVEESDMDEDPNSDVRKLLETAIDLIVDAIELLPEDGECLVDGTMTASQLHEKALEIQRLLNS